MRNIVKPSVDAYRAAFSYNPETGVISWRRCAAPRNAGDIAGTPMKAGYWKITLCGYATYAHRVAWLLHHGQWPVSEIDHINGDKLDNRIANLREASPSQNMCNRGRPKHNKLGVKGVHWHEKRRKYIAQIRVNNRGKHLGYFQTLEEAKAAYAAECLSLHGEFARPE